MRWLPFQLNPDIPAEGMPRADYVARKFGARGKGNYDRVTMVGKTVGIAFAFDRITVQPNTLLAHRLLHHADRMGAQDAVANVLFRAYFEEGANLTDVDTLARYAAQAGLDEKAVAAYLASDTDREAVLAGDVGARSGGVNGVPFFIFNRKIGVSGAQDPDMLLDALKQSLQA